MAIAFVFASAFSPAQAQAHPALLGSSPAAGLIAPRPANAVKLSLSEPVVIEGSRVVIRRLAGEPLAARPLRTSDGGRTLTLIPKQRLREGAYEVDWSALGADGHLVSGQLAFGVAGADGEAPAGAQAVVSFGSRGGRGGEDAAAEGPISVFSRWLGLVCAMFLLGGAALLARLRIVLGDEVAARARRRWRLVATPAWQLMLLAAIQAVIVAATAGVGGSFDFDVLLDSPTGIGSLLQLAALGALSVGLIAPGPLRGRDALLVCGATVVLLTEAFTGHVQTLDDGKIPAALLQGLHVGSAALWLGGVLTLALLAIRRDGAAAVPFAGAARAFAPLAAITLGLAVFTGVLAAVREVDDLYFLRWSAYGQVVLIKSLLVVLAATAGAIALLRAMGGRTSGRLLRGEALVVVTVLGLAALLTGLVPGRGQALPAERGTLLPGAAFASAVAEGGALRVTLAPARAGSNLLSVFQAPLPGEEAAAPESIEARLFCTCGARPRRARLQRGPGGTWTTRVDLPADGDWFARLEVDGKTSSPLALPVGVPDAPGPGPLTVLWVGDLSAAGAERCRSHLLGLQLGIGRLNALGGLDGGRKVAVLALDDAGSSETAGRIAANAIEHERPLALAAPCGDGAGAAVAASAAAGIPSLVADPAVPAVELERTFRLAGDPYAEGYATGQYIRKVVEPAAASDLIRFIDPGSAAAARRLSGLRAALDTTELRIETLPATALESGEIRSLLDRRSAAAVLVDGDPSQVAGALGRLGDGPLQFPPAVILAASPLLSEELIARSGTLGRIGAIQGPSEVAPDSATALAYAQTVPALYPGERPSLIGLRGFLAGLALGEGTEDGIAAARIADRLRRPDPFADALLAPWRDDAPAAGGQRFSLLAGTFLPPTLVPSSAGGETYSGIFFTDGEWRRVTSQPLGPPLDEPPPPLDDGESG